MISVLLPPGSSLPGFYLPFSSQSRAGDRLGHADVSADAHHMRINAHRCASSAYCAKKSSHFFTINCHFAPFFQIPRPRAPVDQHKICRICHQISLNNSTNMLCCSRCINPFSTQKCFFSIPMAHKFNQCNISTGTVAHEILHQNTHWRESKQMQRVQLFLNHIIRHMLTHSGEKPLSF